MSDTGCEIAPTETLKYFHSFANQWLSFPAKSNGFPIGAIAGSESL
jgi:hypothetical protein